MYVHTFDEEQKSILGLLNGIEIVQDFYLAGGTALALQYGHRQSMDFDFFKEEPFDIDKVLRQLSKAVEKGNIEVRTKQESTLLCYIDDISCSFFRYPYPLLQNTLQFNNINLASAADIAAMKISAISTRGTKRDFVDLFFICQRDYSLREVLDFFQEKFQVVKHDLYHVYKSLSYFEDAERDVMPQMYEKADWKEIKTFFNEQVDVLMK